MGVKFNVKGATAVTTYTKEVSGVVTAEESISEVTKQVVVPEHPAVVSIEMGMTKNLGNYESFKISVSLSVPCGTDQASIDQTAEEAYEWVDDRVDKILKEVEDFKK